MEDNPGLEGETHVLEADACPPLAMCPSPVSLHLPSDLHLSLDRSNADQNGIFKQPRSNLLCQIFNSGSSKEVGLTSQEGEVQQAEPATCSAKPITYCPSVVLPRRSPRHLRSLDKSNEVQNGTADLPASMLRSCKSSSMSKKGKLSTGEKELQILEINQDNKKENGENACFFVGEAVPDEEARQRWPHHYVEKVPIS
jgi:hypothetical protein